jgi:hypothetical protein
MTARWQEDRSYTVTINLRRYVQGGQWFVEKTTDPFTTRQVYGPIPDEATAMQVESELVGAFNREWHEACERAKLRQNIEGIVGAT